VKYAFVAQYQQRFSVRMMCRLLRIHPSGFYAWLRMPLSKRACEDKRQIDLLQTAWEESGKVYGYRGSSAAAQGAGQAEAAGMI